MATVCRSLLHHELNLVWFDMMGMLSPGATAVFPRLTEVWDTYKGQLPDLLEANEMWVVASAYRQIKEFSARHAVGGIENYLKESEAVRDSLERAAKVLETRIPGRASSEDKSVQKTA